MEGLDNSQEVYTKQREFLKLTEKGIKSPHHFSQKSKDNQSLGRGGKSVKIREEIGKGITDPKKIAENLGLTSAQVVDSRKVLRGWGVDLPITRRNYDKIEKEIDKENNDEKLQGILDGLSAESITSFIRSNKGQKTFNYLGNLLKELGFSFKSAHLVGERLKEMGIPCKDFKHVIHKGTERERSITYWIIPTKRKQGVVNEINAMFVAGELKKTATKIV